MSLESLLIHLDRHCIRLDEFGCYVALSEDQTTVFQCAILADGSAERDEINHKRMNWLEVTAPERRFVDKINGVFGTSLRYEDFPGR